MLLHKIISRSNRQPAVTIGANYSGRGEGEVLVDVNELLATVQMPEGATAELGGQLAMQQESFGDLFLSLALSIIFVYMVLASQFGSLTQPGIIMISLPLAIIGGMTTSTLLTLFIVPLAYVIWVGFQDRWGLRQAAKKEDKEEKETQQQQTQQAQPQPAQTS